MFICLGSQTTILSRVLFSYIIAEFTVANHWLGSSNLHNLHLRSQSFSKYVQFGRDHSTAILFRVLYSYIVAYIAYYTNQIVNFFYIYFLLIRSTAHVVGLVIMWNKVVSTFYDHVLQFLSFCVCTLQVSASLFVCIISTTYFYRTNLYFPPFFYRRYLTTRLVNLIWSELRWHMLLGIYPGSRRDLRIALWSLWC